MAIADSGLPELEGQLRLVDKISPSSGRLEILLNGLWGTVCSYHFDFRDAVVACKELGYTRLAQLIRKLVLIVTTVYLCVHTCILTATQNTECKSFGNFDRGYINT